jgi:hypothetical protein
MTGTQEPWRGRQQATSGEAPTNEPIDLDQANAGLNPTRNDIGLASGETALDKPHSFRDDKPHSFRDDTKRLRSAPDSRCAMHSECALRMSRAQNNGSALSRTLQVPSLEAP